VTLPPAFAVCAACGAGVEGWRDRLTPVERGALVLTERGDLAVRVRDPDSCAACGNDIVEIRVEEPH